ncbi:MULTISPECIES: hypothetical protein [unclassified Roseofilum]|uniref:hypothetical protein n=1 Tax=unclassified Roseofilum TaxID=2620099 RepID=UPI000E86C152|nr:MULTISPECIES: hypothetical protein [unclassified Roseofilum]MBP0007289.1 hypothetical protein [Roseofilum sp. Belize Diploria]MBP0032499.1 hypothetical protein [Roseofilum sp. Belize BBD 4]HBQ97248.1 hypothetical protein [Cyanobacteria bacterium UBA11691]
MTRQPHDQFAKAYLKELLEPLGTVEISREIPGETLHIDLFFQPSPEPPCNPPPLGLLAQLASKPCLWEPFRNCPSKREISSCVLKLLYIHGEFYRQAKRDTQPIETQTLPTLWILTPTVSERVLDLCGAHSDAKNWCTGIYRFAEIFHTRIIAINQLPEIPETLWLRLLGKGGTQKRAIQQVLDLPENDPQRRNILELIGVWRINVQAKIDLNPEDQELVMELSPAYLKWREDTVREGVRQGIQEGVRQGIQEGVQQAKRVTIETLLRTRFGSLDEELGGMIDSMMERSLEEFIPICMQASREELLARFSREN